MRRELGTGIAGFLGEKAAAILAWVRGFFRANLLVWLGILVALFAYYCVLDAPPAQGSGTSPVGAESPPGSP